MPFLAALGAWGGRFIATGLGYWIASALAALGIGLFADTFVAGPLLETIEGSLVGQPADLIAWIRFLNVDRYITGLFSAYTAAAAVSGLRARKR